MTSPRDLHPAEVARQVADAASQRRRANLLAIGHAPAQAKLVTSDCERRQAEGCRSHGLSPQPTEVAIESFWHCGFCAGVVIVDPDSIDLNDPTLRICDCVCCEDVVLDGPDSSMSVDLYDQDE